LEQQVLGTLAPTDYGWYDFLRRHGEVDEVNFWRPSAERRFNANTFSPFLFKLKAPHNAICGFGFFAKYSALPYWLAWEAFGIGNGCSSPKDMLERVSTIRNRINYRGKSPPEFIGCILIVQPFFFEEKSWIPQPNDWPPRNLTPMRYDLSSGEGQRVWQACLDRVEAHTTSQVSARQITEKHLFYGKPSLVAPRLGQGTFRVAVTDAYARACAITGEHSLPALEAAHIRPYAEEGPHRISNGLLLRADFHRLFDRGYITVTPELDIEVSHRLKLDYENGKSYYPYHGQKITLPSHPDDNPAREFLDWHNTARYFG
jgi:putative restriction endonuclease